MGAGFIRRRTFDPGLAELTAIEGVVIIDRAPPDAITGITTGTTLCVGEFEDGPFNTATEVADGVDLVNTFGGFGYQYDGVPSNNPCARARKADGAIANEYWNGNGWCALVNKRFGRLILSRVDTSVGEVSFTRLAAVVGNSLFSWALTTGLTLTVFKSVTDSDTATFSGAVAQRDTAAGTYPTTFVGGESVTVTIDEGTPQQIGPLVVTFQAADQTQAQVISRINTFLGFTCATSQSATVIRMVGRVPGNLGVVRINAVSGAIVTTATGLTVGATAGTGNVGNLNAVTFNEVKSIVETAVDAVRVDRDAANNLRISALTSPEITIASGSTAASIFGFTVQQSDQEPSGAAFLYSAAGTYPYVAAGTETLTLGRDDELNVTVTFLAGSTAQAAIISRINSFFSTPIVSSASATILRFAGLKNGGQIRIVAGTPALLTALGLTVGTTTAYTKAASVIPAGTRVRTSAALEWVTMQSLAIAATQSVLTAYTAKVRPANDDGTLAGVSALAINTIPFPIAGASFSVQNLLAVSAALSEAAVDARYQTAFDATLNPSTVAKEVNLSFSARQSNAVRVAGRSNAITAAETGLRGRRFAMRPPLGATRALARSAVQQPGNGTYRSERVVYCYPGVATRVPQIAERGLAGGAGFTADGIIDVGSDAWLISIASQLPPEENPGQETAFALNVLSLEKGNADVQGLTINDYIAFKAAGICAPRIDEGVCIFQSGVNNVDPLVKPGVAPINQGRFSDFIGDTISIFANKYSKKSMTPARRAEVFAAVDSFLAGLKSQAFPDSARIEDYSLDAKTGNTPTSLAAGVFRILVKVRMNPDFNVIVFDMTVGATVSVTQLEAA